MDSIARSIPIGEAGVQFASTCSTFNSLIYNAGIHRAAGQPAAPSTVTIIARRWDPNPARLTPQTAGFGAATGLSPCGRLSSR